MKDIGVFNLVKKVKRVNLSLHLQLPLSAFLNVEFMKGILHLILWALKNAPP